MGHTLCSRADLTLPSLTFKNVHKRVEIGQSHKVDGQDGWMLYAPEHVAAMEAALQAGACTVHLQNPTFAYEVDLKSNCQVNTETGTTRLVRRRLGRFGSKYPPPLLLSCRPWQPRTVPASLSVWEVDTPGGWIAFAPITQAFFEDAVTNAQPHVFYSVSARASLILHVVVRRGGGGGGGGSDHNLRRLWSGCTCWIWDS
jgi:hypothetical protein